MDWSSTISYKFQSGIKNSYCRAYIYNKDSDCIHYNHYYSWHLTDRKISFKNQDQNKNNPQSKGRPGTGFVL